MTQLKSIPQLKAIAREKSLGKYGTLIGAAILLGIIRFFVVMISSAFTAGAGGILPLVFGWLITIVVNTLLGVFISGEAYLYMNLIYSQTINISDIFFGFKQQPQKAVAITGIIEVIINVLMLPGYILLFLSRGGQDNVFYMAYLVTMLITLLITLYVKILFSQVYFLLHDFPEWSVSQLISTAIHLMKGRKLKYLGLTLSFIPLYLLGIVTLFIPLLWINVYAYATMAAFYQDLMSGATAQKVEGENGLN